MNATPPQHATPATQHTNLAVLDVLIEILGGLTVRHESL